MTPLEAGCFVQEEILPRWPDSRDDPTPVQMGDWVDGLADLDYQLAVAAAKRLSLTRRFPTRPQPGELRGAYLEAIEGPTLEWVAFWQLLTQCFPAPLPAYGQDPATMEGRRHRQARAQLMVLPFGRLAWDVASALGRDFIHDQSTTTAQARFRDAFNAAREEHRARMLLPEPLGGLGLAAATARVLAVAAARTDETLSLTAAR